MQTLRKTFRYTNKKVEYCNRISPIKVSDCGKQKTCKARVDAIKKELGKKFKRIYDYIAEHHNFPVGLYGNRDYFHETYFKYRDCAVKNPTVDNLETWKNILDKEHVKKTWRRAKYKDPKYS